MVRNAERERMSAVADLHRSTTQMQSQIAMGLGAVNTLVERVVDRLDGLDAEVEELRTRLRIADARIDDLVKRGATGAMDLPNPLPLKRVK